jgi:hypothetical protein
MGIELRLGLGLGFLILGPKRMHEMAGYLSRTKAQLAKAGRGLPCELEAELGRESAADPPPAADPNHGVPPDFGRLADRSGADTGSGLTN